SHGMLVEIPPRVEYSYSGKMKLICISKPRWFSGNDKYTKWNPDVVQAVFPPPANAEAWKLFAQRLINRYLRLNGILWRKLPASLSSLGPMRSYGDLVHTLARRYGGRAQNP